MISTIVTIGVLALIVFGAVWYIAIRPNVFEGQVSSVNTVDNLLWKSDKVEFYGGTEADFFHTDDIHNAKPNTVCKVETAGWYLKSLQCK